MKTYGVEVIIIGAGHAGLSASWLLKQAGVKHLVLERGRIGESWLSQRWDSFRMISKNAMNKLPGMDAPADDAAAFSSAYQFAGQLRSYANAWQLEVEEQATVTTLTKNPGEDYFAVVAAKEKDTITYKAKQVIVCSGGLNQMLLPAVSKKMPAAVFQLHAGQYRNAGQLPAGAVLVVGSAQSGCQLAADLVDQGRTVYLCTSRVPRLPRRYRGRDIMDWMSATGFLDMTPEVAGPTLYLKPAQLMAGDETISLQLMQRKGVTVLGRLQDVHEEILQLGSNANEHVQFADDFSVEAKRRVDEFIQKNNIDAPAAVDDPADRPDPAGICASGLLSLNLAALQINTIVWATGFTGNFDYIKLPVLNAGGQPVHRDGIAGVPGLYFLGLPWLRKRKSALVYGTTEDAAFICERVLQGLSDGGAAVTFE